MVFPTTPEEVLAANPDAVSHSCYGAYQAMARRPATYGERFPVDASLFARGDNPAMAALFRTMHAARHPARRHACASIARASAGDARAQPPPIARSISPRG